MDQNDSCVYDYKKWLAFNSGLTNSQEALNLYNAIHNKSTYGNYSCDIFSDTDNRFYLIKQTASSLPPLRIDESEKELILSYLQKHYLHLKDEAKLQEKKTNSDNIENTQAIVINLRGHFFLNYNIAFHSIGYALIAIVFMQVSVLPKLIGVNLHEAIKWLSLLIVALVCHGGVWLYRRNFFPNGIQYVTTSKITIGIFGLTFSGLALEVMLFQIFSDGGSANSIGIVAAGAGIVIFGLMAGWFFSLPIYFLNAGKRNASGKKSS